MEYFRFRNIFKYIAYFTNYFVNIITQIIETALASMPNWSPFSTFRLWYWRCKGYNFGDNLFIARNVYFQGKVKIAAGSHIANNCLMNGSTAGIYIGEKVMIAPNCVLAAFDHGYSDLNVPMLDQKWESAPIIIENDVWIGANSTITKGVTIGKGAIVGGNSIVTRDVEEYMIVGGVPAKVIGSRKK